MQLLRDQGNGGPGLEELYQKSRQTTLTMRVQVLERQMTLLLQEIAHLRTILDRQKDPS